MKRLIPLYGKLVCVGVLVLSEALAAGQTWTSTKEFTTEAPVMAMSEKTALRNVLTKLEERYKVHFGYLDKLVDNKFVAKVVISGKSVEADLTAMLTPLQLEFTKVRNSFYLIQERQSNHPQSDEAHGNGVDNMSAHLGNNVAIASTVSYYSYREDAIVFTVSGIVTDQTDGTPLPGVNVLVKGTSIGTTTDANGRFSLEAPEENSILIFSFIGYASQEVSIDSRSVIDVAMHVDTQTLSEVVVVGYGTVKKTDLTGAVAVIDNEEITKRGAVNPLEGMQGQVAGVDISNSTGRAGAGFNIQIRGQQSFNGGKPLYVVDGVITPDGIDFLNPQDIARIDILKDASSTAIYGSRGAYGVVLVTTKQGSSVKERSAISYDGYVGLRKAARLPDFMAGDKWWNYRQDSFISDAIIKGNAIPAAPGDNSRNSTELQRRVNEKDFTNWPGLLIQDGRQANHWISIAGAGDKMGYNFGMGYQEETGNIINEEYKRYNFKGSIDHTLNEQWQAGTSINLAVIENEQGSPNAMTNAFRMSPLLHPYATGTDEIIIQPGKDIINAGEPDEIKHIDFTSTINPLVDMANANRETRAFIVLGNVYLQYKPINWLSLKTTFAPRYRHNRDGIFLGSNSEGRLGKQPYAELNTMESFSYIWDNQVAVNKTINDHAFALMGLFSTNMFRDEETNTSQDNLPFSAKSFYNIGDIINNVSDFKTDYIYRKETIMSYAFRLNYAFKDKYLVTLSTRWDGASVLAEGNKWQSFPSAAVAWKLSEEDFISNVGLISSLKFRASYGFTGNKVVSPYETVAFAATKTYYDFGGTPATGLFPNGVANQELTWEKTRELNLGLDFSLLNYRISGSVDVYNKRSEDTILERDLPLESGWESLFQNIGVISNKGVEISLTTTNVSTNNITWTTSLNFARNKNEVVELYGGSQELIPDDNMIWRVGESLGSHYNYVFDGIWQQSESEQADVYSQRPGMARVVDFNTNDAIDPTDRRVLGSVLPDWTGGFSTTLTYKAFDLSASLVSRQGVLVFSRFHQEFTNFEDRGRAKLDFDWYMEQNPITPTRVSTQYPQPKGAGTYWNTNGVGYYKDASFVKVKNITLGYNLPSVLLSKAKISSLRVYANILNPFVFTEYEGFDPEWADASYNDGGMSSVVYQLGVNLKF